MASRRKLDNIIGQVKTCEDVKTTSFIIKKSKEGTRDVHVLISSAYVIMTTGGAEAMVFFVSDSIETILISAN